MPASEFFLAREVEEACRYVLTNEAHKALQYGVTEGYPPLRAYLVGKMRKYGIVVEEDNILITNGSQQALDLVGRVFIDSGDVVLTEAPTYLGALQAWNVYGPRYVTVSLDDDGLEVDQLEDVLKREPVKFIYVLPNFHNPAGVTLSLERREKLVEIAANYGVCIVEDDPYGELRFEGEDLPPLAALGGGKVLYLSTFSKTLSPGMRLGWIAAPKEVIGKLVQVKQGADLHTSTFVQMVANDICQRGILHPSVLRLRQVYKERRDAMLASMEKYFPPGVSWTRPQGGLFLWVTLPEHVDATEFLKVAVEEKVAFVPGTAFYPDGCGHNYMRLSFSNVTPEVIEEGIKRLGQALVREFG
jgi:2-aminoadipate transaminase